MRNLYKDLVETFEERGPQALPTDQGDIGCHRFFIRAHSLSILTGIFNEYLAARRLSLDYYSRLFWATSFASPTTTCHFINTPYHIDSIIPHHMYPPLLHQAQTGEIPVAIHFDGHTEKGLMDEWWGKLWWHQLQGEEQRFRDIVLARLEGAKINFAGGDQKVWGDICSWPTLGV
jgi:hypothetical protein